MKTYLLIPTCLVLAFSCKKDPPVVPEPTLLLTAADASCIEAWLRVTTTDIPATARLLRDGQPVSVLDLRSPDSLLVDEGLLPKQTYTYQLQKLGSDSGVIETSASVQVTTMDTTSHSFTWQIDTLGDGSSSVLYDVAIISDNNIWAVGELFQRDSSGQLDPLRYNAAHWDGSRWNVIRVPYIYQGTPFHSAIKCVFAFSDTDIWFSNSVHWNGQQFHNVDLAIQIFTGVGINKMWGNATTGELYVVGNSGTIAYSPDRGSTWHQLESGTSERLTDVFGAGNGKQVWACGFNDSNGGGIVLRVSNGQSEIIWDRLAPPRPPYIYASYLSSLWSPGSGEIVLVGGRFYRQSLLDVKIVRNEYIYRPDGSSYIFQLGNFAYQVRGSARNNLLLAGDHGMIWHWNGATWFRYDQLLNSNISLYGLDVTTNQVFAVGARSSGLDDRAIIIRGRR